MNNKIINVRIDKEAKQGVAPSIVLSNPKFSHNVSMVTRLASCYGIEQVWFTGTRVDFDLQQKKRMPREERMKGFREVDIINFDRPFDYMPSDAVPVAVEVRENSEPLHLFDHPEKAVYVFGPEDGNIAKEFRHLCHRFLIIPTRHCLNLATAVSAILWDREYKKFLKNADTSFVTPGVFERRGYEDFDDQNLFVS